MPNISCIGIITVPLSPKKKYYKVCGDSYISTAHISMLKRVGLSVVAIPYTIAADRFDYYMDRINGLYFPSGGVFAGNSVEYYQCCKEFMQRAIARNNEGTHFPVWGACMGMQQMMMIADGRDNLEMLEYFDSMDNLMLPMEFPEDPRTTQLFRDVPSDLLVRLQAEPCSLNNHKMGLSTRTFLRNKRISDFYRIVSTSKDRVGKEFVATIEAHDYPFYGFQWHPERNKDMDYLASVFKEDASRNKRARTIANRDKLPYRRVHCMTYSNHIYKYCNFYWHNRTSYHNAELCSVLNFGKPVGSAV
jgi:gamma-glutamyl hydrolase